MVLSMRIHTHYTMTHIDRGAVKQVTKIWQGVRDDDEGYQVMDEGRGVKIKELVVKVKGEW